MNRCTFMIASTSPLSTFTVTCSSYSFRNCSKLAHNLLICFNMIAINVEYVINVLIGSKINFKT